MERIQRLLNTWLARSGDDTFWSWVITVTYIIAIVFCFAYVRKLKGSKEAREERFLWIVISLFVLVLGVNKQLDLQILFIMIGKYSARTLDIYEYRFVIYGIFFLAAALFFLISGFYLLIKARRVIGRALPALGGSAILALFVLIRIIGLPVHRVHGMELLGLLLIMGNLVLNFRRRERETRVY